MSVDVMRYAVSFHTRTCRKCRSRWQLSVRPQESKKIEGAYVHVVQFRELPALQGVRQSS